MNKYKYYLYDPLIIVDHINLITKTTLSQSESDKISKRMNEMRKELNIKLVVNGKEWNSIKENGE